MRPPSVPLIIAPKYQHFVEQELLSGLEISAEKFWQTLHDLLDQFSPRQAALLAHRDDLQQQLDAWYGANPDFDDQQQQNFLREIGYIVAEGEDFCITSTNVDPEITDIAGPQLVVPVSNARYALNAANARYGSLFDALYGTDVLGSLPPAGDFNLERADSVIKHTQNWLDEAFPLVGMLHSEVTKYCVVDNQLCAQKTDQTTTLVSEHAYVGYRGDSPTTPKSIILKNNGLHVVLHIDATSMIGKLHPAGIADIELEAALSAIMDLEDSIAAVDADDKVAAYRNMLGLLRGDLEETFTRNGRQIVRTMNKDESYHDHHGTAQILKRRALLWIRNVGHLMTNPTVRDSRATETFEGLLDAITTVVAGMHDLNGARMNSSTGSIYVVKPKMHGPEEVAFTDDIFSFLEEAFGLPRYTVKIGIMDEERRTSANLKECIRAAKHRLAFINTGFLDRTGDEIHTAMQAGAFLPKHRIKQQNWIAAYEARNVEIGIQCGLPGKAQIGKGMWAMPDRMAEMLKEKIAHPLSGANCSWVPSPTAATIHALHYHEVDVRAIQNKMAQEPHNDRLSTLLEIPLLAGENLSHEEIMREAENNAQGILGYVVRWIDQGVGCSKVPDIDHVALMEDRATCRISSQMLANWLLHGIISPEEMQKVMQKMAAVVDGQNAGDPHYRNMAPDFDGFAFQAAMALVFQGVDSPSGYTEPILHTYRGLAKQEG